MRVGELVEKFAPEIVVLAGHECLDASIRWVHATDLPDPSRYLRGGELILTNGQWRHRRADSERFVDCVSAAGVVAIGYGLTKAATRTPKDLIAACEAAGLPLLQIPHDMAFVEISEEVASDHAAQRERGLVGRLRRDEVLLRSVSRGGGLDGVLRILARDYGVPFVLVDHAGQTVGSAVPNDGALAVARAAAAGAEQSQPTGTTADGFDVTVFPVAAAGAVEAFLVCFRAFTEWTEDEQDAIRHELAFLGLELSRVLMSREFNERLADELLELVAEGEARTMELAARLRSFMIDPDRPLVAIVLSVRDTEDTGITRRAARAAGGMLSRRGIAGVVAVDGSVAIVIASSVDDTPLAADLAQTLCGEGVPVNAAVGSPSQTGVRGLRRSVAEARLAADYAHLRGGAGGVTTYADAGSYRVLLAAQGADSRAAFARAVLGPVLDQDRERGSDLIPTLDAFLQDGGHWQRVAEQLHLHVNTLRYRIGRVEQLTGRSMSSFEERVNLFIALEALRNAGGALGPLEDPPN
jgi:sugar diacid utilization regulator